MHRLKRDLRVREQLRLIHYCVTRQRTGGNLLPVTLSDEGIGPPYPSVFVRSRVDAIYGGGGHPLVAAPE